MQSDVGNLNDLTTEAKNNLVAAINEAAASGGAGMGVDTPENAVKLLAVSGIVQPVSDANGKLYVDGNGKFFVI